METPFASREVSKTTFLTTLSKSFNNPSSYPDLTITTTSETLNAHRLILCAQSAWFEGACAGKWKESTSQNIFLQNDDPQQVREMLRYCYNSDYEPPKEDPMLFHMGMVAIADKYFVKGLGKVALDKFRAAAETALLTGEMQKLVDAARAAYQDGTHSCLRQTLIEVLLHRKQDLFGDEHGLFKDLIREGGDLAVDVLVAMEASRISTLNLASVHSAQGGEVGANYSGYPLSRRNWVNHATLAQRGSHQADEASGQR